MSPTYLTPKVIEWVKHVAKLRAHDKGNAKRKISREPATPGKVVKHNYDLGIWAPSADKVTYICANAL